MKKNARLVAIILATIFVLATMCLALVACNEDDDKKGGLSAADWETVVTAFKEATGGTDEFDVIISNFSSFNFSDGKFTAERIDLSDGVTLQNIVVELDETGAIKLISYEKRTTDANTPDRIITVDANGVTSEDVPKPTDSEKMDKDEWNEQVEVFANVTNYTLARTRNGVNVGTMKLDGIKYYDSVDDEEAVIVPVDSKYYIYEKTKSQTTWTRSETTASRYQSRVNFPRTLVAVAAAAISGGFDQFTFNAGVYTLDELYLEDYDTTLRDIKVTVSGKAIVKAICILVDGYYGDGDEVVTVDHVGSTVVTIPTNYDEYQPPKPQPSVTDDRRMTEDEWENAVNIFANSTNFTTVGVQAYASDITRRSGDTVYTEHIGGDHTHETEYAGTVYTKEGESYVKWTQPKPTDQWTKTYIEQAEYDEQFSDAAEMVAMVSMVLGENYDLFTFDNGVYYSEKNVEVGINAYLANLRIVVAKGQIARFSYTMMYRMEGDDDKNLGDYVMTDIGSTTAFDPSSIDDISGKIFVCNGLYPANGIDPTNPEENEELNANRQQNEGLTLTFSDDHQFRSESGPNAFVSMIGTGSWSQEGAIITVTITSMNMGGDDMEISEPIQYIFTYNGCELVQVVSDQDGNVQYYPVYTERF